MKIYPLGESALTVQFAEKISPEANAWAIAFADFLEAEPFAGFVEAAAAFCSTTVFFDLLRVEKTAATAAESVEMLLRKRLEKLWAGTPTTAESGMLKTAQLLSSEKADKDNQRVISLAVEYGGPDLEAILAEKGLSKAAFIRLHTAPAYRVAMIGFLPGFPYLLGLDPRLEMARKARPSLRVEAGSVAVGGAQTGVYSLASPGGWWVVGRVRERLFDARRADPFLLRAGDVVRFEAWKA